MKIRFSETALQDIYTVMGLVGFAGPVGILYCSYGKLSWPLLDIWIGGFYRPNKGFCRLYFLVNLKTLNFNLFMVGTMHGILFKNKGKH